jgi:hypothetical protein
MIIQRINRTNPEKVFIIVRNDHTSAIAKGGICVFNFDGTRNGQDVVPPSASDDAHTTLLAGLADDAIGAGAYGMAQVYGIRTDAPMYKHGSVTSDAGAVGNVMKVVTASNLLTQIAVGAVTSWLPNIVLGEVFAASNDSDGTTSAAVFLRMM